MNDKAVNRKFIAQPKHKKQTQKNQGGSEYKKGMLIYAKKSKYDEDNPVFMVQ